MLKALLFGIALVGAAVIAIAATAFLAVLFLFLSPVNASQVPHTHLLEPVEEVETINVVVAEEKNEPEATEELIEEIPRVVKEVIIEERITKQPQEKDPRKLKKMTKVQLQELGKTYGIELKLSLLKDEMISRLTA